MKFTWSHSAISDFDTCPMQYAHKRFYKTVQHQDTEATIWGTRVHKVAEDILNGLPVNDPEAEILVRHYTDLFLKVGGELGVEKKMALTEDWKPCDFFSDEACGRVISDVLIVKDDVVHVFDYKSGKRRDKHGKLKSIGNDQLIINCVCAAIHYPQAQEFHGKYIYLHEHDFQHKTPGLARPLTRQELLPHLKVLQEKINRMKEAWSNEIFATKTSGLCRGWCPVTECVHYRGPR